MDSTSVTSHTVIIDQSDFLIWLEANIGNLILDSASLRPSLSFENTDNRILEIVFPVYQTFLDTFLHTVIPDLPKWGEYKIQVISGTSTEVGRITWNS